MPDSLRTRIANVIWEALRKQNNTVNFDALADAVIRELGNPIRGCTDPWHWSTGEPYRCPSCGYWMGEGYV